MAPASHWGSQDRTRLPSQTVAPQAGALSPPSVQPRRWGQVFLFLHLLPHPGETGRPPLSLTPKGRVSAPQRSPPVPHEAVPRKPGSTWGLRSRAPFLVPALAPAPKAVTSKSHRAENPPPSLLPSHSVRTGRHRDGGPASGGGAGMAWWLRDASAGARLRTEKGQHPTVSPSKALGGQHLNPTPLGALFSPEGPSPFQL